MSEPRKGTFWQTTCSALAEGRAPEWSDVEDYREPLRLLLGLRYSWLRQEDREDLVQDILLEIRERLYQHYRSDRARFRTFLAAVVRNRVLARWKRSRKRQSLEAAAEPEYTPGEAATIDLVASVLAALRRWHRQRPRDRAGQLASYVLASRLLGGQTYEEIAAREALSIDGAKRLMLKARKAILADIIEHTIDLPEGERNGVDWQRLAGLTLKALKRPGERRQILDTVGQAGLRGALEGWLKEWLQALEHLPRSEAAGSELYQGLELIFSD